MFQARFQYENHLVGEWFNVNTESILYPNPEYKCQLIAVQFRETEDLPQPPKKKNWKYDPARKVIHNG